MEQAHRETAIRRWFAMWLEKRDLGLADLFAPDAVYMGELGTGISGPA